MNKNQQDVGAPLQQLHRFVWFFSESAFRQSAVMAALIERSRGVFDGPVQALPLPADAPNEIPRISLRNESGELRLQSSLDRLLIERVHNGIASADLLEDDLRLVADVFPTVKDVMGGRIARVAYNRNRSYNAEGGAMKLVHYFCRADFASRDTIPPGPLSRCKNFEIHAHKTYQIQPNITINSWVRCKTGNSVLNGVPVFAVEQDLNTLAEDMATHDFDHEDAVTILRNMFSESDEIYNLYFPTGIPQ